MKYLSILLVSFSFFGFKTDVRENDFSQLYQNWSWAGYEFGSKHEYTYKPSAEFGNSYGYQFRKNGTFAICRGATLFPESIDMNFEVAEGKWKIIQDSIIALSYKSNKRTYDQQLVVRKLSKDELIVHLKKGK